MDLRSSLPYAGMFVLYIAVVGLALYLVVPFADAGMEVSDAPEDPSNTLVFVGLVLAMTAGMIAAMKFDFDFVVRVGVLFSVGVLSFYVASAFLPDVAGVAVAGVVVLSLYVHPEWYVVDGAGVLVGAGGAAIFGISLSPLPAVLLLGLLAVYDAVAVYRTKHMLTLADGVMEMRLPVLFVVPRSLDYSFLEHEAVEDDDRDALYMGLGDAVIPTVLAASALRFLDAPLAVNHAAQGAVVGGFLGFAFLMLLVSRGKPHAGLPLLNGGSIAGFFLGALAMGSTPLEALGL
ncbi:MAG: presenilin family intramembrane aspartyl protease PSH [Halobacteriales archaeon]